MPRYGPAGPGTHVTSPRGVAVRLRMSWHSCDSSFQKSVAEQRTLNPRTAPTILRRTGGTSPIASPLTRCPASRRRPPGWRTGAHARSTGNGMSSRGRRAATGPAPDETALTVSGRVGGPGARDDAGRPRRAQPGRLPAPRRRLAPSWSCQPASGASLVNGRRAAGAKTGAGQAGAGGGSEARTGYKPGQPRSTGGEYLFGSCGIPWSEAAIPSAM